VTANEKEQGWIEARAADRQSRAGSHGPTISDRIGEQITEAWKTFAQLDAQYAAETSDVVKMRAIDDTRKRVRGRILGLSQALAIIRLAPRQATSSDIKSVAEEFKP
jgi:hypothetical protein